MGSVDQSLVGDVYRARVLQCLLDRALARASEMEQKAQEAVLALDLAADLNIWCAEFITSLLDRPSTLPEMHLEQEPTSASCPFTMAALLLDFKLAKERSADYERQVSSLELRIQQLQMELTEARLHRLWRQRPAFYRDEDDEVKKESSEI